MRKFLLITLLVLPPLTFVGNYLATNLISAILANELEIRLSQIGFEQAQLPDADIRFTEALFTDIKLDPQGFSTIKYVLIEFNPLSLIMDQQINTIKIIDTNISGELNDSQKLTLAGWNNAAQPGELAHNKTTSIEIKDLSLELFTPSFGNLSLDIDLIARPNKHAMDIQGSIETRQKHFAFDGQLNGFISDTNAWQMEIDLTRGRADFDSIKGSRINGKAKLSGNYAQNDFNIVTKLDAGGITLFSTPWQGASATFSQEHGQAPKFFLGAKSLGQQALLDLSVQFLKDSQPAPWSATISGQSMRDLLTYLDSQGFYLSADENIQDYKDLRNITAEFWINPRRTDETTTSVLYTITSQEENIEISGLIEIER